MEQIFDLVIIGGGPAGYEAALEAAKYRMKTVLIEKDKIGGTCLNRGCIPTKTLLHSCELYAQMKKCSAFGIHSDEVRCSMEEIQERKDCLNRGCIPTKTLLHSCELYAQMKKCSAFGIHSDEVRCSMEEIQERKDEVLGTLRDGILSLMKKNKITVYSGCGRLLDANHVQVCSENELDPDVVLETKNILIASGSVPAMPPIPGIHLPNVLTSDELLDKKDVFASLTIIGGGVIGMEFAAIYSALGNCSIKRMYLRA